MANRISPCRMRVRDGEGAIKRADCTCVPENGEASSPATGRAKRARGTPAWPGLAKRAAGRRKRHAFPLLAGEARQFSGAMTGPGQPPFDNKERTMSLGARYRIGGWFALPGTCLVPFREKGWL